MRTNRDNRRGILAMAFAMAAFNLCDALTKLAMLELPLGETVFLRGLIVTAMVAVWVTVEGSWTQIGVIADTRVVLRLVGELGSTLFYLMALVRIPLPNVSAVFQATPLAMTVAAALFLGEKVGPARWATIAVGFLGVLVILRPGFAGFSHHAVWVLVSVVFVVLRDISTARIGGDLPTSLVTLVTAATVMLFGLAVEPFDPQLSIVPDWVAPTPRQTALLAATALALLGGYVLLIKATQYAETSAIAPYRYSLLVWAFLYGVLLFGDLPDPPTLVGAAIVVATGLYGFRQERLRSPARATRPSSR